MKILDTQKTPTVAAKTSPIYEDALRIRQAVFVDEQQVPPELEIDEYEVQCVYFVLYNDDDRAVATARLLPNGAHTGSATLQRMAVVKEYRGKGYGREVITRVEVFAAQNQFSEIVLHAQLTAKGFYTKMGYTPFGEEFEEANIKHISMKKKITHNS
ncbi:acetyltransferase [Candidatus Symbiothrix dinenymphae]|nr:acetyltransferase [Candidatus Symbiothrix dinenymphae]